MTDWREGAVLYQIYPRSFNDTSGNGIGDLEGITRKLDYIRDLGVDGIWISPFFPSPMIDNGYDVSDYYDVDPIFGTLRCFDRLVEAAHRRDLKIVIDQVYSHTSDQHKWFQESRGAQGSLYADWYVWEEALPGGAPPNNWQAWFSHSAWNWDPSRRQYYLANFHPKMPDLNLHNDAVQNAILQVAKFWLDRGVDGFRLDACNFYTHDRSLKSNPPKHNETAHAPVEMQEHIYNVCQPETSRFLERLRQLCDKYEERFLIGEISSEDDISRTAEYTQSGRLHTAYSFKFLRDTFAPDYVKSVLESISEKNTEALPTLAFSNHDTPRVATRWSNGQADPDRIKMINMLMLMLRGNACLYQGQELGLSQVEIAFENLQDPAALTGWPNYKGRDGCRTPMPWHSDQPYLGFSSTKPWLPLGEAHKDSSVNIQSETQDSILAHLKAALTFRNRHSALRSGRIRFLEASEQGLVFERYTKNERWLCVFNLSDRIYSPRHHYRTDQAADNFASQAMVDAALPPHAYTISLQLTA